MKLHARLLLLAALTLSTSLHAQTEGNEALPPLLVEPAGDYAKKEKALDEELTATLETPRKVYSDMLHAVIDKVDKGNDGRQADLVRGELKRFEKSGLNGEPSDKQPAPVKTAFKTLQKEEEKATAAQAPKRTALRNAYLKSLSEIEKAYVEKNDERALALVRRARAFVTQQAALETNQVTILGSDPKLATIRGDGPPGGGYLVGVETGSGPWMGFKVMGGLKPVFQGEEGLYTGPAHGNYNADNKVLAKDGYAVGGIVIRPRESPGIQSFVVGSVQLIFMKIKPDGGSLDPEDNYKSDWIGGEGGGKAKEINGHGKMVIGIRTKPGEIIDNVCLVTTK